MVLLVALMLAHLANYKLCVFVARGSVGGRRRGGGHFEYGMRDWAGIYTTLSTTRTVGF